MLRKIFASIFKKNVTTNATHENDKEVKPNRMLESEKLAQEKETDRLSVIDRNIELQRIFQLREQEKLIAALETERLAKAAHEKTLVYAKLFAEDKVEKIIFDISKTISQIIQQLEVKIQFWKNKLVDLTPIAPLDVAAYNQNAKATIEFERYLNEIFAEISAQIKAKETYPYYFENYLRPKIFCELTNRANAKLYNFNLSGQDKNAFLLNVISAPTIEVLHIYLQFHRNFQTLTESDICPLKEDKLDKFKVISEGCNILFSRTEKDILEFDAAMRKSFETLSAYKTISLGHNNITTFKNEAQHNPPTAVAVNELSKNTRRFSC